MSGRFNEPRLMGNCENCYYATEEQPTGDNWYEKGTRWKCHRFPKAVKVRRGHYCGRVRVEARRVDAEGERMSEVCGDDRFELISKAKGKLLESTNIEDRPEIWRGDAE